MKRLFLFSLVILLCGAQPFLVNKRLAFQPASGGGACAAWSGQSATTDADYWTTAPLAQGIHITGAGTVCQADLKLSEASDGTSASITVGFWSNKDGTGTQYGNSSDAVVVTALTGAPAVITFTWSGTKPNLTVDCYLVPVSSTGAYRWRSSTTDVYASGNAWENSNDRSPADFYFVLYKL